MLKIFLLTVFIRVAVTINCTNRSAFTSNTANARITSRIISSYNNDTKNKETPLLFWKNYNSNNGITLLVDDISSTQMSAYNFLKRLDEVDPEVLQRTPIQLMKFNSSATRIILNLCLHDLKTFENELSIKENETRSNLGLNYERHVATSIYIGLLNAIQHTPNEGGIIVFVDRISIDQLFLHVAINDALKKDIRIYVVWSSLATKTNQEKLLDDMTAVTGGKFFINSEKNLSELNYQMFYETLDDKPVPSIILTQFNLLGLDILKFPVEYGVTGLHIIISPYVAYGYIITQNGVKLNIMNGNEIAQYGIGSFSIRNENFHEIYLNTATASTSGVGLWQMMLQNARAPYNLTVYGYTNITTNVYVLENLTDTDLSQGKLKNIVKINVTGDVQDIDNISFINESGQEIIKNLQYSIDTKFSDHQKLIINNETQGITVSIKNLPDEKMYAIVTGTDSKGNQFERVSYVNQFKNNMYPQEPLTIDVGIGSELITTPSKYFNIYFQVTNNDNRANIVRFGCGDEKYFLNDMFPYSKVISPSETFVVRTTLSAKYAARDLVTFYATGNAGRAEKRVFVDVGNGNNLYDDTDPDIYNHYTSDCTDLLIGDCGKGTWVVKITVQDSGSGILQVTSKPAGIYFPNGFTAGTKDQVIGYYSDSCCSPDFQVTAVDRSNNRRVLNMNAYHTVWNAGTIAAIILGILLFLIIIAALVFGIRKWRNRQGSFNLPVYRGRRY